MIRFLLCFLLYFISTVSVAQIDSSQVSRSPHGVIYNHLYYLQKDSYEPSKAALSIPEEYLEREKLAIRLKKVIDGKGFYVDINRLPKKSNYLDSLTNENIYFIDRDEPRIYV